MKKLAILIYIIVYVAVNAQDSTFIGSEGNFAFKYQLHNTNYVSTRLQQIPDLAATNNISRIDPVQSEINYNALYWVSGITAVSLTTSKSSGRSNFGRSAII